MKVVILAGGFGTRLGDLTEAAPKPMIPVMGKPIIQHIMEHYSRYGFNDFVVALGYKGDVIKNYFSNFREINSDFEVCLRTGVKKYYASTSYDWKITLIDTGLHTMTGGRIKRLKKYLEGETFLMTYGDGLSDINITDLVNFHLNHRKMLTITAVKPKARFGELQIHENNVSDFFEKPKMSEGWVNGGFFVVNTEFLDLIEGDDSVLEREPIEKAVKQQQVFAYKHEGFWHCIDTKRDLDAAEAYLNTPS